jgi:tetratricopeptide (TPR) repeat protein
MQRLLLAVLALSILTAGETPPRDLLGEVIVLNRVQEPELDAAALRAAFGTLVDDLRPRLAAVTGPRDRIAVLNAALLAEREVAYLANLYWRDATLAAGLLRRRGNCLSTATLYHLVGRELDLPVRAVLVPGHAFARWDDGTERINIETTAGGRELPDAHYLTRGNRVDPADVAALGWCRQLTDDELLAELTHVVAQHHRGSGDLAAADAALERALALWPGRSDWLLARATLAADRGGDRELAARQVLGLIQREGMPPTVVVGGLCWLADEAGARRDFARQRAILLEAFAQAPKPAQLGVLNELASCHRSLQDWRGAVRYMELALVLTPPGSPGLAGMFYNLSIYQKNDGDLPGALASVERALAINPESWNLLVIKAGYLVLAGRREEGLRLFATVTEPRADRVFWLNMNAWFHSVCGDRERFYPAFERALAAADGTGTLIWIDQDVDLDTFRGETRFQDLLRQHRERILGAGAAVP